MTETSPSESSRCLSDGTVVPRLAGDALRQIVASAVLVVLTLVLSAIQLWGNGGSDGLAELQADPLGASLGLVLVGLTVYSGLYVTMTLLVMRRARGEQLRAWLLAVDPERSRRQRILTMLAGGGSLAYGVSVSLLAVGTVLILILRPDLARSALTSVGSIGTIAGSWCVLMCVFAVRYAELWARGAGIVFPDDSAGRRFSDFVYLAVQVSTTFSSSDVQLSSPEARNAVTAHSILAFAFNTVIIALLVSVVVSR